MKFAYILALIAIICAVAVVAQETYASASFTLKVHTEKDAAGFQTALSTWFDKCTAPTIRARVNAKGNTAKYGVVMTTEQSKSTDCTQAALETAVKAWVNVSNWVVTADFKVDTCAPSGMITCTAAECKATPACNNAQMYSFVFAIAVAVIGAFLF